TDGSDPRLSGGGLNPGAQLYQSPIVISSNTRIRTRVLSSSSWSALNDATFTIPSASPTPAPFNAGNIAVFQADNASVNNTTFSIVELSATTPGANPIQTIS